MKNIRVLASTMSIIMLFGILAGCGSKPVVKNPTTTSSSALESTTSDGEDILSSSTAVTTSVSGTNKSGVTTNSGATKATVYVPTVTVNTDDKNATLPKLTINNKNITVCIDWSPSSSWVKAWVKALDMCYPGMKITWKVATPDQKASKLAVWKSTNTSPDLIYIKPEESWPTLINKGLVDPVDSYIDINSAFWGSARDTMNSLKISNKQYCLVTSSYLYGSVIYKRDIFKNAGLEDPTSLLFKDKWTWSIFESYAQKLTKINASDDTKSKYGIYLAYGEPFFGSTGKDLIEYSSKGWISNLNNSSIKNAINFITSIGPTGKKYCLTSDNEPESIKNKVRSGQIGMYVTASDMGIEFPNEAKSGALLSVPIPRMTSSAKYYHAGVVDCFAIPKGAKNPIGGVALANSVRAMALKLIKLPNDGTVERLSTDEQDNIRAYALSKVVIVPMQFRRVESVCKYYTIWGPGFFSGTSYSSIVAKQEPGILEELKKQ